MPDDYDMLSELQRALETIGGGGARRCDSDLGTKRGHRKTGHDILIFISWEAPDPCGSLRASADAFFCERKQRMRGTFRPTRDDEAIGGSRMSRQYKVFAMVGALVAIFAVGLVLALIVASRGMGPAKPIITVVQSADETLEDAVLRAFRDYATAHPDKVTAGADLDAETDQIGTGPATFRNGSIALVHLAQSYRDIPVHGDRARISFVLRDETQVLRIFGGLIDQSEDYDGLTGQLSAGEARQSIEEHWINDSPGGTFDVGPIRLVALPDRQQVAFAGEISSPLFTSSRTIEATVLINAASGDLIAIEDRPAEARVLATRTDDDPRDMDLVFYDDQPTRILGNSIDFSDHPDIDCNPAGWRPVRMGDDTRLAVVSFDGLSGSTMSHFIAPQCATGGQTADFTGGGAPGPVDDLNEQQYAQDIFVKTRVAMSFIDPLMGEMVSHGASHPYSWDHPPSTPDMIHRGPALDVVNASAAWFDSSPGINKLAELSEADTDALDLPLPHPLVIHCRNGSGAQVDCDAPDAGPPLQFMSLIGVRAPPPFQSRTLYHEIGHYYDRFNAYGISGDNGEIIAQLFALYLHRRVYDLDYRLTENPSVECSLSTLVSHSAGTVVHPQCITDSDQISTEIEFEGPYTVRSFTQAYWSLLNAVSCTAAGGVLSCDEAGSVPPEYADRWMEALLFALQVGNDLEPVEIWDAMALFIDANYPQDNQRLQTVRALHGLL